MAQSTAAEQFLQNESAEKAAVGTPQTDRNSDSRLVFADRLKKTMRERGSAAAAEAARLGPPGVDAARINRLVIQFDAADRNPMRDAINGENQLVQQGYDSFSPAERNGLTSRMRGILETSGMGVAFQTLYTDDERNEIATSLLQNEHFLHLYDKRLKEIAGRNVNPTDEEVKDRATVYSSTTDTMERALVERIATQDIIENKIAAEIAGLPVIAPPRTPAEARTLAIQNLTTAGTIPPAAGDVTVRADALQLTPNDPTLSQAAVEIVARQDMIEENQDAIVDSLNNIMSDTATEMQQVYADGANATKSEDYGNIIIQRAIDEVREDIRQYSPDAYRPNGQVVQNFRDFIALGPEIFLDNDPDAVEALRLNPELRKKFAAEVIQELTMARMRVKRPPMNDDDMNRLASHEALGKTPMERIRAIHNMFETHEMFKNVREAGKAGGMLDRDKWDKIFDAVKKSAKPAGVIAAVLLLLTTTAVMPVSTAVLMGTLFGGGGLLAKGKIDFQNDAKGRTYEPEFR